MLQTIFEAIENEEQTHENWSLKLRSRLMEEQFRIRRNLKQLGIKITSNEKGTFTALLRGYKIEEKMDPHMVQLKTQALLEEFI